MTEANVTELSLCDGDGVDTNDDDDEEDDDEEWDLFIDVFCDVDEVADDEGKDDDGEWDERTPEREDREAGLEKFPRALPGWARRFHDTKSSLASWSALCISLATRWAYTPSRRVSAACLGEGSLRLRSAAILLSTILSSCWALSRALRLIGGP